jgi:hypothetical protein
MTARSIAKPAAPETRKARNRDGERVVEQYGRVVADRLLHDEGRVGAEHHHLAMRHVDDAHHPEGDGEADRGEEQHRSERQPVPDILRRVPDRKVLMDVRNRGGGGVLHRGGRIGRKGAQDRHRIVVASRGDDFDGINAIRFRGFVVRDENGRPRLLQNLLDRRIGFPGDRSLDHRERARLARLQHRLGRDKALGGIFAKQTERAKRRFDRSAHAVVDLDLLQAERLVAADQFSGRGVGERVIRTHDEGFLVRLGEIEAAILQRADDLGRAFGPGRGNRVDGLQRVAITVLGKAAESVAEIVGTRGAHECRTTKKQR